MHITSKDDVYEQEDIKSGEIIYELIGLPPELGGAKSHSLAFVALPAGKSSRRHYHHESEETYYILHGAARLIIDGNEFPLRPGQACFIEPYERHQIFNDGPDTVEFVAISAPPWKLDDSTFA
jgi:mannose-6-phosphate isomerase-like protein (cupin superfamily)